MQISQSPIYRRYTNEGSEHPVHLLFHCKKKKEKRKGKKREGELFAEDIRKNGRMVFRTSYGWLFSERERCRKLFEEKVYGSPRCISSYNVIFFQVQRRKCNGYDYYFFFDVIVHDKSRLICSRNDLQVFYPILRLI